MSDITPHTSEIYDEIQPLLRAYWDIRDREYGSSWCKDGLAGVIFNVMRKADRLRTWLQRVGTGAEPPVPDVDTIVDLAAYANAQLAWVAYNHVGPFHLWLEAAAKKYPEMHPHLDAYKARQT